MNAGRWPTMILFWTVPMGRIAERIESDYTAAILRRRRKGCGMSDFQGGECGVNMGLLVKQLHADRAKDLAAVRDALAEIIRDMKRECEDKGADPRDVDIFMVASALDLLEEATYLAETGKI